MQLLAVSMNYASYIRTLQPRGLGSQETIVWNPTTTAYRFQARLLASSVSRWMDRGSLTFRAENEYLPWNAPDEVQPPTIEIDPDEESPPATEMDLSKFDEHLDFWWVMVHDTKIRMREADCVKAEIWRDKISTAWLDGK